MNHAAILSRERKRAGRFLIRSLTLAAPSAELRPGRSYASRETAEGGGM